MKNSLACPKCQSRRLWRIERYATHGEDGVGGSRVEMAVLVSRGGLIQRDRVGSFDALVCSQCGYTEFWAHEFEKLEHNPDDGVHLIDTTPQQGQYR